MLPIYVKDVVGDDTLLSLQIAFGSKWHIFKIGSMNETDTILLEKTPFVNSPPYEALFGIHVFNKCLRASLLNETDGLAVTLKTLHLFIVHFGKTSNKHIWSSVCNDRQHSRKTIIYQ